MKVSKWKEMLDKLNDEDELCIAIPSQDFGLIRIKYNKPSICKKSEIDKTWELQEINRFIEQDADYVIY